MKGKELDKKGMGRLGEERRDNVSEARNEPKEFRGGSSGSEPISRPVEFLEKLTSI